MRVLYFSRAYTPHDRRFLSALANTAHEVFFLQLERQKHTLEDRPVPREIRVVSWAGGHIEFNFRDVPRLLDDLKTIIRSLEPDLVHAGPIQTSALLAALADLRPLVSMSWGYDLLQDADRNPFYRRATRYTLSHSAVMVGDCETVRQKAISYGMEGDRIVTFPWGVDLIRFTPDGAALSIEEEVHPGEAFTLLSTRSWEPVYGVDILAKAFVNAARKRPEIRLILLGSGSQAELLRRIFEEGGVLDRVQFTGQVSNADLARYYRSADLYVSASHSDGSSISLLEAMASGRPVIVSDLPGNREWVEPDANGWLFPDGDSHALAECILQAMEDRSRLERMGRAGRAIAEERADWRLNFPHLLQAYEMALQGELERLDGNMAAPGPKKPRIIAIIQARMASSRLPGKVLLDIAGATMLERVVERTRRSHWIDQVIVATTVDSSDNEIESLCADRGYPCFRGSPSDVLDRYYQAARIYRGDVIVRITADCPMIDPGLIDQTIEAFFEPPVLENHEESRSGPHGCPWDFAANRLPPPWKRTFPIGLDTEVCTLQALERAWKEASEPHQREHVMPYLYEQGGRFRVRQINHEPDYGALRWTVDTAEDLELARRIYAHFDGREDFSWEEVLALFEEHPELQAINAGVQHKNVRDIDSRS